MKANMKDKEPTIIVHYSRNVEGDFLEKLSQKRLEIISNIVYRVLSSKA